MHYSSKDYILNTIVDFVNAFWAPIALLLGTAGNLFAGFLLRFLPATHRAKHPFAPFSSPLGAQPSDSPVRLSHAILLSLAALGIAGVLLFAAGLVSIGAKLCLAATITLVCTSWRRAINNANVTLDSQTEYVQAPPIHGEKYLESPNLNSQKPKIEVSPRDAAAKVLNQGLVAPLFWLILLGFPGMAMYKMADSLCAQNVYTNAPGKPPRLGAMWLHFALSYIPGWCTMLLMCIATGKPQAISTAWRKVKREGGVGKNYCNSVLKEIFRRHDDKFDTTDEECAKNDPIGSKQDANETDELSVITRVIIVVSIIALGVAEGVLIARAVV